MASVTKRGSNWYAMWRGAAGKLAQKATPARTKVEAMRFATDKERQAWRQREGLAPLPDEHVPLGELLDWWWQRYGSARRGYANESAGRSSRSTSAACARSRSGGRPTSSGRSRSGREK